MRVLFLLIVMIGSSAFASASLSLPEVGLHTPLLRFEKNENPQNKMVVYTKLDPATCSFTKDSKPPILDEYWLMNGEKFKKVNALIKQAVGQRLEFDQAAFKTSQRFLVHLKDFHELKSDLGTSPTFEVKPTKKVGSEGCDAIVEMKLGPSDHERRVAIESIYADSSKQFLPPFRKLNSLTIRGKDATTGENVSRT